jgi:hypothetical protein
MQFMVLRFIHRPRKNSKHIKYTVTARKETGFRYAKRKASDVELNRRVDECRQR